MSRSKVIIFISGNGSNLQNIINNIDNGFLKMDITAVVSNNPNAKGLVRAEEAGIETMIIDTSNKYIDELLTLINTYNIDLILLSGFMKILPKDFTDKFYGKIMNLHPSLLPKFNSSLLILSKFLLGASILITRPPNL